MFWLAVVRVYGELPPSRAMQARNEVGLYPTYLGIICVLQLSASQQRVLIALSTALLLLLAALGAIALGIATLQQVLMHIWTGVAYSNGSWWSLVWSMLDGRKTGELQYQCRIEC
jgi:urease accessory protein UreF